MSTGLFFQLLVCAVCIAVYMFGIESNVNPMIIVVSILGLAISLLSTYAYCFLSEFVTYKLSDIGDHFYNCAWYRLPIKHQKLLVLPIQRAQVEFRITGLGLVECSLRVFSSVILKSNIFITIFYVTNTFSYSTHRLFEPHGRTFY